jgi:GDP-L-fucose synthase
LAGCETVFHLAAIGWGLHENVNRQPELFTENVLLSTSVLDAAYRSGAGRYLYCSSSAVYPASIETLDEDDPLVGPPHPSELGFGSAKRIGEMQARLYAQYHGMRVAIVRPSNVYGPGDDFNPARSHLIPALIARVTAGERPLRVRGNGRALRSFIYVDDVARAMMSAVRLGAEGPTNVASPAVTSVGDVARLVALECGMGPDDVSFEDDAATGPPAKRPLTGRLGTIMDLDTLTSLREGVARTAHWYRHARTQGTEA